PPMDEEHAFDHGVGRYDRTRNPPRPYHDLNNCLAVTHAEIIAYLVMYPTFSSKPEKNTDASGGTAAPRPYTSVHETCRAMSEGSWWNASNADTSAVLAPPMRQDCSSTPEHHRPLAS